MAAASAALARRAFADGRVRTFTFAALYLFVAYANVVGYAHSFPTLRDRVAFARGFGESASLRLFYGVPRDLLSTSGYVAWRVGGFMCLFSAIWGVLAAVRALRAEEDAGRAELVLAGAVSRRAAYLSALAAIAAGVLVLWTATFAGLVLTGDLPAGGAAYLALAVAATAPVFAGVGALASQLAPTRRLALELGIGIVAVAFVVRVVADTSAGAGWLRWATPLGWVEELRAFTGPRPAVLLCFAAASALLLLAAGLVAARRDVGRGLVEAHDRRAPRGRLLSSPTALALRGERGSLLAWLLGVGGFAFVLGVISAGFTNVHVSRNLREELRRIGGASVTTPSGALGLYFLFFVLAIALFACAQVAAARREESEQRLETLFALPVGRRGWLAGRLALAFAGAVALAFAAGVLAWAGAAAQGAGVAFGDMLAAGANCLPAALLFLGLGALSFALVPRAGTAIAYGLVSGAFVWQLFGSVLGAPAWLLDLSPFRHVGLVPGQPFQLGGALAMLAVAALTSAAALRIFARRDLTAS